MANVARNNNFTQLFTFLKNETLTDVTLMAEGKSIKAHKLILAAASKYFEELFVKLLDKHPVIVLKDVPVKFLILILEYVYCGTVDLAAEDVDEFQRVAESMQITVMFDGELDETVELMSQETIPTNLESADDDTMDPSYEDIMGISETSMAISAVRSLSRDPKRLAKSLSDLKHEPPAKRNKIKQAEEGEMTMKPSVGSPIIGQCIYCDKSLREKDRNYHQKFCWKNLNRVKSDCNLCTRKFEFPSKLRQHQKISHAGKAV